MLCCKKYSPVSAVTIDVEDEQGHLTLPLIESNTSEKEVQSQVIDFFKLLEKIIQYKRKKRDYNALVAEACTILKDNRNLIIYQHCRDNKIRSLLHFTKYNIEVPYDAKQIIVATIIDGGFNMFSFSENNTESQNYHSYFFTAAKGEFDQLVQIVEYFRNNERTSKLHDTREGDTVLSFMIKFGNHAKEGFVQCFSYLIEQGIDFNRIDYFKDTVSKIIDKEKRFLNTIGKSVDSITTIESIIEENNTAKQNNPYDKKHKIFRSLIEGNKIQLKELLTEAIQIDKSQIDCDDGENTLLQLAIIKNNLEVVEMLLKKGANPNYATQNKEVPLILAAKLNRDDIFNGILNSHHTIVTERIFIKLISSKIKTKLFNCLLEFNNLNVEYSYNGNTPLYYAIRRNNKKAIQTLLQKGAKLEDNCASNINPKDLEEYLNSCIKFDTFKDDLEENDYKAFVIFDFFIKPPMSDENDNNHNENKIPLRKHESEIDNIQKIGSNKRLAHLLEHPVVYIFILLKWYSVNKYYYCFVILKFLFYTCIGFLVYNTFTDLFVLAPVVVVQFIIVYFNVVEFKLKYKQYTLHFVLEVLIFLLLVIICILKYVSGTKNVIKEISAFIIILTALSILLTLGYHINLSKWMSMAKRVFKNFGILLAFFLFPILAFAIAFNLLLPFENVQTENISTPPPMENEDFTNIPRAVFRTFILLSGDIGDKKFSLFGGYIMFLFFSIGMAIILLNFWTGVAVSDIKEIEEKSIVVAFKNVIVFIDGIERIYNFIIYVLLKRVLKDATIRKIRNRLALPFLARTVDLKRTKRKVRKYHYGVDLFINDENHFKHDKYFKRLRLDNEVISKIKSLCDSNEQNISRTLKYLVDRIDDVHQRLVSYESRFKEMEKEAIKRKTRSYQTIEASTSSEKLKNVIN